MIPPTMKAAVHTGSVPVGLRDFAVPRPSLPDHVLVRVGAAVSAEATSMTWTTRPEWRQTPGHEFAGVIAALGNEPGGFAPGERVLVRPRARCGVCDGCTAVRGPGVSGAECMAAGATNSRPGRWPSMSSF